MAHQHMDGFDWYGDPSLRYASYGGLTGGNNIVLLDGTAGRSGGGCLRMASFHAYVDFPLTGNPTRILGQGALFVGAVSLTQATEDYTLIAFMEGLVCHAGFVQTPTGAIKAQGGPGGSTLLAISGGGMLVADVWNPFKFDVTIHDSAGAMTLVMNGQTLTVSGVDTRQAGLGVLTAVRAGGGQVRGINRNCDHRYDDIWIYDASGAQPNAWQGDKRIRFYGAASAGAHADFTPLASTNVSQLIDAAKTPATPSSTNAGTDVLTFAAPHGYYTGMPFVAETAGGGLNSHTGSAYTQTYFAQVLSSTTIAVHLSRADAIANTGRVDLTASITSVLTPIRNPDCDESYNQSAVVGDIDSVVHDAMTGNPQVFGVQSLLVARKTDGGSGQVVALLRDGATDHANANTHDLTTEYFTYPDFYLVQPDTAAWDQTAFNAHEIGVKRTA